MDFSFEFGGDPQDVTVTLWGDASAHGLRRMNEELLADGRYVPGLAILVDLTGLDTGRMDDEGLRTATVAIAERDWHTPPLAIALVAPDERTFADARRYSAYLGGSASGRAIFSTREDAIAWLRERRAAA
jgi:hypothetical protein